ncbi:MAG: Trk system potassium transport protein TrkA [Rickettsiales bacterium]|jgi:trk system potassium uptake protein TrkA|nr:Trk system potassium transport protein TrkA [Rickettsiales bacterium]
MRIIICGAGQVGTSIARQLAKESHDVTIIDHSGDSIRRISDSLDVNTYIGFASHPSVLEEAGASHADMLIAVTGTDEVNMVTCQVAKSLFNVPKKIARVRNQNYLEEQWKDLYRQDHLPIDVIISPELEVARAVNQRLHVPGAIETIPFINGKLKVLAVRCSMDCPLIDRPLYRLNERLHNSLISIVGILRGEHLLIPGENERLMPGDEVFFITPSENVPHAMELFGFEGREARRLIIIGGGNIGLYLAQELEAAHEDTRIKIIELDRERAEFIAGKLERTTVINGSALEHEILQEANVWGAETVIAVSNNDQVNILASLLAKRFGAKRALTLVKSDSYTPLMSSLGIDVDVNPREITVSSILQHIRCEGNIKAVHTICNGAAEIIEAKADASSPIIGKMLKSLELPSQVMVGMIVRDKTMVIPTENTIIHAGDCLIMLCMAAAVKTVEDVFSVKFEYF